MTDRAARPSLLRRLYDRIVAAAEACAEILARNLPPKPDQRNEISDALREI